MASDFHITILLPDRVAYEGKASSLVVPAELGYLGVLAHHAPIIARLKAGKITLREGGKVTSFELDSNGFLEFSDNNATLVLNSIKLLPS